MSEMKCPQNRNQKERERERERRGRGEEEERANEEEVTTSAALFRELCEQRRNIDKIRASV